MKLTRSQARRVIREELEDLQLRESLPSFLKAKKIDPQLTTVGDLRKFIDVVNSEKRSEKGAAAIKDVATGALLDLIPGAGTAMTLMGAIRGMYKAPDDKKTDTKLDLLNIDDEVSRIVDDTVEDNFLKVAGDQLDDLPDSAPMPNMTGILSKYLGGKYDGRTVAGFQESRDTGDKRRITEAHLRKVIRDELLLTLGESRLMEATLTAEYQGKTYKASPAVIAILKKYNWDGTKAIADGKFDWAKKKGINPWPLIQAATIVGTGKPITKKGPVQ